MNYNNINNFAQKYINSDEIKYLPSDKIRPSENEMFLVNNLFQDDDRTNLRDKIVSNIHEPIIVAILFVCFSCSSIDELLIKLPYVNNNLSLLFIKICLLMIIVIFMRMYFNKSSNK